MVEVMNKMETSRWWWFDSHYNGPKRSPWLQSTLSELDKKTEVMLRLIEEDADSFAKRAEMYYKKRPELISLVEDFYRAYRSLAERYDQVKSDPGTRIVTTLGSTFSSMNSSPDKTTNVMDKAYDSYSETFGSEDYAESEVDDPEHEHEEEMEEEFENPKQEGNYITHMVTKGVDDEVMKLREEIERLKEDNKVQKAQLMQKDEEKREVIRQLSLAFQVVKDENIELNKSIIVKESPKKQSTLQFRKSKGGFFGMLFNGSLMSRATFVAL